MANEQNLVPLTTEKAREIGKKGGIASGIAKKQKRTLKEIGEMIGGLDIKSEKTIEILKKAGIASDDMIKDVAMMFRLSLKAEGGDVKAIELVAKLRGQLKEQISAEVAEVKPLVDLTKRKKNGTE